VPWRVVKTTTMFVQSVLVRTACCDCMILRPCRLGYLWVASGASANLTKLQATDPSLRSCKICFPALGCATSSSDLGSLDVLPVAQWVKEIRSLRAVKSNIDSKRRTLSWRNGPKRKKGSYSKGISDKVFSPNAFAERLIPGRAHLVSTHPTSSGNLKGLLSLSQDENKSAGGQSV
jgi:hypothetical protein